MRGASPSRSPAEGSELVVGENVEGQPEAAVQFVLPLLRQTAGADHETALEIATGNELLHQQAGHDGLAGAGIVRQQERSGWRGSMASYTCPLRILVLRDKSSNNMAS